jgi:hypothetical protein
VGEMLTVGVEDGPGARCTAIVNVTLPAASNWKVIGNDSDGNSALVNPCSWITGMSAA